MAAARDLNRRREFRATGQIVGSGSAELEQRTDVTDADQVICVRSSLPDVTRLVNRASRRIWQGDHDLDGKWGGRDY
jgi:hypothetical protein